MRKNKFLITTLIVSAAIGMSGCGKESSTETTTSTTPEAQTTTEVQTTTEPETTTEQTTTSDYSGDYSEYSTEIVEYGVGTRRLEDGRYEGPIYCQNKYSDYKVEFIKENEKVIYLTFDEGYENGYTASILDTLKEKDVKAVFFVTMDYVESEPELVQRMIDEGHILGSHSVTHPSMPTLSVEEQKQEYLGLHTYIKEKFGYDMYLFRPPMGHFSEQSLAIAEDMGYTTVLWSFAHVDWIVDDQPTHEEALQTTTERLHNGAIYLLHAVSESNTAILGAFIDEARAEGYTFKEYTRN